jgi:hypothetical protein
MMRFTSFSSALIVAATVGGIAPILCIAQQASTTSEYRYTTVDYPGSPTSICIGINARGELACSATGFSEALPYRYNWRSRLITLIPVAPASGWNALAFGINDFDTVVGYVYPSDDSVENGFVVTKNGDYKEFVVPWAAYTEGRGINNRGLITGTAFLADGSVAGFIYDRTSETYTKLLPSAYTEAVGITTDGRVVGTVYLDAGTAGLSAPGGQYGYLRAPDGSVTYYRVNGQDTYARGISDEGKIVGYFGDRPFPQVTGFVASVSRLHSTNTPGTGFVALSIPPKSQLKIPGAFGTLPQGVSPSGVIGGTFVDSSGDPHGFIARPKDD